MMKDKTICDHLEMLWKRIPKAPNPCYCHTFEEQFTVTDVVESKGNVSRLTVLSRRIRSGIGTC